MTIWISVAKACTDLGMYSDLHTEASRKARRHEFKVNLVLTGHITSRATGKSIEVSEADVKRIDRERNEGKISISKQGVVAEIGKAKHAIAA